MKVEVVRCWQGGRWDTEDISIPRTGDINRAALQKCLDLSAGGPGVLMHVSILSVKQDGEEE